MARDAFETDVGGELRDRYGRPEYVLVPKHTTPLASDVSRAYQPTDADGRIHMVMQDQAGNDFATTVSGPVAFGAVGDGVKGTAGAMTSGASDLTDPAAHWTVADIGKPIMVKGAGASNGSTASHLVTTIASIVSLTHVTLAASAAFTVSAATYLYGTDDHVGLAAALAATPAGGTLDLGGRTYVSTTILSLSADRARIKNGTLLLLGQPGIQFIGTDQISDAVWYYGRTDNQGNWTINQAQSATVWIGGTGFRWWYSRAYGGFGYALGLAGGVCDGAYFAGGLARGERVGQDTACVSILPAAAGNHDIVFEKLVASGPGWSAFNSTFQPTSPFGTTSGLAVSNGILAFDTARCSYNDCTVFGCTKQPAITTSGWVQQTQLPGCSTTNTSQIVTMPSTSGAVAGNAISGPGISAGATILSVDSETQLHLDAAHPATATASPVTLTTNLSVWRNRSAVGTNPGVDGPTNDRNDGNTESLYLNTVYVSGSDYIVSTQPHAGTWSVSGGYLYLNVATTAAATVGPNDGTITIISQGVGGYGITNYNSSNNFLGMDENHVHGCTVYATDGFGIYWALHQPATFAGGATTNGSAIATMTSTASLVANIPITGTGIPFGTVVLSVDSSTQIHLSQNATATNSGLTFSAGGSFGNKTSENKVSWACLQGQQDGVLPWAGIAWNGGTDSVMVGDTVRRSGGLPTVARKGPGVYFSDGSNSVACTGEATGVQAIACANDGFFLGATGWTLTGCAADSNFNNGYNCSNVGASVVWEEILLSDCRAINNGSGSAAGRGLLVSTTGGGTTRVKVVGGTYANNWLQGILYSTALDSAVVGVTLHGNNRAASGQPSLQMANVTRGTIQSNTIYNESVGVSLTGTSTVILVGGNNTAGCVTGLSVAAGISFLTIAPNTWTSCSTQAILLSTTAPSLAMLPQVFSGNGANVTNASNLPWITQGSAGLGDATWRGSGAPTFTATTGDRYERTDTPGTVNQRLYICTSGATPTWVALAL